MLTENAHDTAESMLPRFFIKNDTNLKYMSQKIIAELESSQKYAEKPKAVSIYASGAAIETALKIANEICNRFPEGLHRTTNSVLHLTDKGESLGKENILDKEKLGWLMRGELGVKDPTCDQKFKFLLNQHLTSSVHITLSLEKLTWMTEDVSYQRPKVPIKKYEKIMKQGKNFGYKGPFTQVSMNQQTASH